MTFADKHDKGASKNSSARPNGSGRTDQQLPAALAQHRHHQLQLQHPHLLNEISNGNAGRCKPAANLISTSQLEALGDLHSELRRHHHHHPERSSPISPRALSSAPTTKSPTSALSTSSSSSSSSSSAYSTASSPTHSKLVPNDSQSSPSPSTGSAAAVKRSTGTCNDSLRYEYDDHYFLTDPDEFIYEFFPLSTEWQLIKSRAITLTEFEQLPFVRSLFFKYGLYFPQQDIRSVLTADSSGATTIKIGMPTHMIPSLIFHYNLKYYDSDLEHFEGINLKRFVMQSVESG